MGFACAGVAFNFFYDSGHSVSLPHQSGMIGGIQIEVIDDGKGTIVHVPRRMRRTKPIGSKKL